MDNSKTGADQSPRQSRRYLVVIDDPPVDKSASSPSEAAAVERVTPEPILRAVTVVRTDDVVDKLIDGDRQ